MSEIENELPDDIYENVKNLSSLGEEFFDQGKNAEAIKTWLEALSLLPEPKNIWEATLWLYAALGDAYLTQGNLEEALSYFQRAYNAADGYENPYILYSLGATLYDLNRKDESTDYLLRAYMLEGEEIFEDDGEKYFEWLKIKKLIKTTFLRKTNFDNK